jgi:hypothetical protein
MVLVEVADDGGDAVVIVHVAIVTPRTIRCHPFLAAVGIPA